MEELRTSEYWHERFKKENNMFIGDPDGWDRKNYNFCWYKELISWEEFNRRAGFSTIYHISELRGA